MFWWCKDLPQISICSVMTTRFLVTCSFMTALRTDLTDIARIVFITEADFARSKALFLLITKNKTKMKTKIFFIIHLQNENRSIPSSVGFRNLYQGGVIGFFPLSIHVYVFQSYWRHYSKATSIMLHRPEKLFWWFLLTEHPNQMSKIAFLNLSVLYI